MGHPELSCKQRTATQGLPLRPSQKGHIRSDILRLPRPKISVWGFSSYDCSNRGGMRARSNRDFRSGRHSIVTEPHFSSFFRGFFVFRLRFFVSGRSAPVVPDDATYFLAVLSGLQSSQAFPGPKEIGNPTVVAQQSINDPPSGPHDLGRD